MNRPGGPFAFVAILEKRGPCRRFLSCLFRLQLVLLLLTPVSPNSEAALNWIQGAGYRSARILPAGASLEIHDNSSGRDSVGFRELDAGSLGIHFTNRLAKTRCTTNQIYLNASGVTAGDIDGDGWCDLYFAGLDGDNVLYRNLGGWHFEDITSSAGVACAGLDSSGCVFADLDGDGDLDLVVNSVMGGTHLFFNDGKGKFTERGVLNLGRGGTSLALADIDGDGDLDLYIANYRTDTIRDQPNLQIHMKMVNGRTVISGVNDRPASDPQFAGRFTLDARNQVIENGEPDALFVNDGRGNFTIVPFTGGSFLDETGRPFTTLLYDWALSVMFRDMNGDGLPDIYVCNDFGSPDRIWRNIGSGRFQALPRQALRSTSLFSMGIDFADINRDGRDDFIVLDMLSRDHGKRNMQLGGVIRPETSLGGIADRPQYSRNTLFLQREDGGYSEIGQYAGLDASEWSWTPIFLDVDLDGYEDLLISTGYALEMMNSDVQEQAEKWKSTRSMSSLELLQLRHLFPALELPKVAFRNLGNLRFEDVSGEWGFKTKAIAQGMIAVDLDNDGDLDLVASHLNGPSGIYRNESRAPRLAVRLRGINGNTRGIGAKISVSGGAVPKQSQEMICGGRYLSGDDAMRVFAAGKKTNRMTIECRWPSGRRSVVEQAEADRIYEIDEAGATGSSPPPPAAEKPLFEDRSARLAHRHHEEPFDDFARQPLLAKRFSQLGPGVCWHDVDDDGWDDLIIGSGRGGRLAVFLNDHAAGFRLMTNGPVTRPAARDMAGIVAAGGLVLVGSSNYEDGATNGGAIRVYDLNRKIAGDSVLGQSFSTGPLALADIDGDGDLDLFVGGRVLAGRYPEAAPSVLLKNENGKFVIARKWDMMGLASAAVFSDLDGDGDPDLVVACEWGALRYFRNDGGNLNEATDEVGLSAFTGWWNGVATADLDGDGQMEIIASNWGLNSRFRPVAGHPLRVWFGDFAGEGRVDLIESYFDAAKGRDLPRRNFPALSTALPFLREKFGSFEAFGKASAQDVLGEKLNSSRMTEARTLASTVFFWKDGKYRPREMPAEAQWAPGFGLAVGDLDGDGCEDIFLGQNFFAVADDIGRHDAGIGLWLKGDGHGGLEAVSGARSGIIVHGEQRGCALCDYDADGRADLVLAQNAAETKLFHNTGARPGLRVRLRGPPENPSVVGAVLRLRGDNGFGPAREIHAGSGYWSQDSPVQVMSLPSAAREIAVRWPGGKSTVHPIPAGAKEIEITANGTARVVR